MEPRQDRIALIEILDRDGRVARSMDVRRWPLSLGRALDNDLVLDDPHVAAAHAQLQLDDSGALRLSVGDTVNGVSVGDQTHAAGAQVSLPAAGALMQVGGLRLRLRLPGETLAPERELAPPSRSRAGLLFMAGLLLMTLTLLTHALALDPQADATAWMPPLLGLPVVIAGWCGIWALASKLFQHRFDFMGHLRVTLPWLLAIELVDALLEPLAASLAWPGLWRAVAPAQALMGALMLRQQLLLVLPLSRRGVSAVVALATGVAAAISLTITHRATDRFSRPAYMSTLPLPGLILADPVPAPLLLQEMATLAQALAARVRKTKADEEDDAQFD